MSKIIKIDMNKYIYDDRNFAVGILEDDGTGVAVIRNMQGIPVAVVEGDEAWGYNGNYLGVLKNYVLHRARVKRFRAAKVSPGYKNIVMKKYIDKVKKIKRIEW